MKENTTKEKQFAEIYINTYESLRRYITRKNISTLCVDDILQDVYLEVFNHIDILMEHPNKTGWVYSTANNKIKKINSIYKSKMRNEIPYSEEVQSSRAKETDLTNHLLEECKIALSDYEFELLRKKIAEGYSYRELSELNGDTVCNNKVRICRIIKKLRRMLCCIFLLI